MSLFIKQRKVFFEQAEKPIRLQQYDNTQKSSRVRAYNRNFIIFTVTSVTVLQQHPNKQHVITIFGVKSSRFILHIIERRLFQRFILRLSSLFFRTCVTLVTAKNQKLGWNARAYARVSIYQQILSPSLSVHFPDYKKNFITQKHRFAIQRYHSTHFLQKKMHFFEFLRLFCALSPHICIEQLIYQLYQTFWTPTRENNPFHHFND